MTDAELDALEAAAKAVCPGDWEWFSGEERLYVGSGSFDTRDLDEYDAEYICAANPVAILGLIKEVRSLKDRIAKAKKALK